MCRETATIGADDSSGDANATGRVGLHYSAISDLDSNNDLFLSRLEEHTRSPRAMALWQLQQQKAGGRYVSAVAERFAAILLDSYKESMEVDGTASKHATVYLERCLAIYAQVIEKHSWLSQELVAAGALQVVRELCIKEEGNDVACAILGAGCSVTSRSSTVQFIEFPLSVGRNSHKETPTPPLLLQQVSQRQSAQADVGFGTYIMQFNMDRIALLSYIDHTVLWPASVFLSHWLVKHCKEVLPIHEESVCAPPVRIVEVGAGCGLVGLTAARLLEFHNNSTVSQNATSVVLTDHPDHTVVLENLRRNVQLNGLDRLCRVDGLDFNEIHTAIPTHQSYDLVLAADVICQHADAVGLGQALQRLARPKGGKVVIVSGAAHHRYGVEMLPKQLPCIGWDWQVSCIRLQEEEETKNLYEHTMGYLRGMELVMYIGIRT